MFGLIGDVLQRTPILKALKDIYPNAEIVAIVDATAQMVLSHNPHVKSMIVIQKNKADKLQKNIAKIKGILSIRKEKFDLFLNLYNGGSSPLLVLLSGARYKLGFCQKKKPFLYNVKNDCEEERIREAQRVSSYLISIVEPLSEKQYPLEPVFDVSRSVEEEIREEFLKYNHSINKIYLLNLGSSQEDKILENEKYLYIVKYIYDNYGFIPAIICNPGQEYLQENFINDFLKPSGLQYIKLRIMSLEEIAASIKLTPFLITPDTGLMHLAMAYKQMIFTIFTYTHPLFVNPHNDKFISVFEHFDEGILYQHQNITEKTLEQKIQVLFAKLKPSS